MYICVYYSEPVKAAQCFNNARDGVANESFLRDRLLQSDEAQIRKLEVLYYLKVYAVYYFSGLLKNIPSLELETEKKAFG